MDLGSFILGVVASLIATWLFWKYQLMVLPRVTLCDDVSVEQSAEGSLICRFKVINAGNNQVVDITLNAWLTELAERGGVNVSRSIEQYEIKNTATLTLAPRIKEDRPWGLTSELTASFTTNDDIFSILDDPNKKIIATLRAADALSRSTVVIQKSYTKENLILGQFKAHQSIVVLPEEVTGSNKSLNQTGAKNSPPG